MTASVDCGTLKAIFCFLTEQMHRLKSSMKYADLSFPFHDKNITTFGSLGYCFEGPAIAVALLKFCVHRLYSTTFWLMEITFTLF